MRIAVLTHTFPPTNHGNAKRPYYVVKGLLNAGWQVDVYTSSYGCEGNTDVLKHPKLTVHVISDFKQKLFRIAKKTPVISKLCSKVVTGLSWPDVNAAWVKIVCRRLLEDNSYDRVLAFVFPASMFLAGKYEGLVDESWTFDLQESVTPQAKIVMRKSPLYQWRLPRLEALEKQSMSKAGKVIFTANTNCNTYIDAGIIEQSKTLHIPHFYDESYFRKIEETKLLSGFNIAYYGTFDWSGSRSPETFFNSFRKFLDANPEAQIEAKFVFYGTWLSEHNQLIEDLELADNVQINKAVSYEEYMKKLPNSNALLLLVSSEHNLFMPSKIVDYFGAQRPILAYVPVGSEMEQVLKDAEMENYSISERDIDGGAEAIKLLWNAYQRGELAVKANKVKEWSFGSVMPKYIQCLEH